MTTASACTHHRFRFCSRDPIGYVDGMSLYQSYFVLKGEDPSGQRFVGNVCPACFGDYQACSFRNGANYAACLGGPSLVGELGCAGLCAWLGPSGPGFGICFSLCSLGNLAWFGLVTMTTCNEALERESMNCGNDYNRCSYYRPRDECCNENWRPD